MALPKWREEAIARHHNRKAFDCGEPMLNEYLRRYARQNHTSGGAKTFVAVPLDEPVRVLGYYSLSPAEVSIDRVPERVRQGHGRYPLPGFRLARLAVARDHQDQGLGGQLLLSAGERCLAAASEVGGVVLLIDAMNDAVVRWYEEFGALSLIDCPLQLVLPLATIDATLRAIGR